MSDPVILSSYDAGRHNADLEQTVSRLDKELSWRDLSTIMVTPTGVGVDTSCLTKDELSELDRLLKRCGTSLSGGIHPKIVASWEAMIVPPNNRFIRLTAVGLEVGEAYSRCIESILAHPDLSNWKYLLTREHDNSVPQDGFVQLARRMEEHPEFAAIGGLYYTKGPGGCAQIWGDPDDMPMNFRPQKPDINGGLVECNGTGMGFTLFRLSMFKDNRLRRPWFKTVSNSRDGTGTQDLYFSGDARKHGYRFAIDCSVKVGHFDAASDTMW
jgi:hypothetical protein